MRFSSNSHRFQTKHLTPLQRKLLPLSRSLGFLKSEAPCLSPSRAWGTRGKVWALGERVTGLANSQGQHSTSTWSPVRGGELDGQGGTAGRHNCTSRTERGKGLKPRAGTQSAWVQETACDGGMAQGSRCAWILSRITYPISQVSGLRLAASC